MADEFRPNPNRPIYQGSNAPLNPSRCKAGVSSNDRRSYYAQCARPAYVDGWCKQHHPNAQAERDRLAHEKHMKQQRKHAMGWFGESFMAALVKIRDGDNDPRETARDALSGCDYAPAEAVMFAANGKGE